MDLGDYVKRELKKGFSKKEIKDALLKAGHKEARIDAALAKQERFKKHLPNLKIGIGILISAALIFAAYYLLFGIPLSTYDLADRYDTQFKDAHYFLLAQSQNDISLCEEISVSTTCKATLQQDPAICSVLTGFELRDCIFFATKTIENCPYLPQYCQALIDRNPSLCEIEGEMQLFIDSCKAEATLNAAYFLEKDKEALSRALYETAAAREDPQLCNHIEVQEYKELCEDVT